MTSTTATSSPTAEGRDPVDPRAAHLSAVGSLYEAFGRGDLPVILDLLADDISWDADWADNFAQRTALDHFLPRRGHAQVAEFFAVLTGYTVHDFQVQALMAGDGHVVAKILIELTHPSGGRYRDEELHLWTFGRDGKITALRHYIDTAKHLAAASGNDTTAH